jgi:hypothetical protein
MNLAMKRAIAGAPPPHRRREKTFNRFNFFKELSRTTHSRVEYCDDGVFSCHPI